MKQDKFRSVIANFSSYLEDWLAARCESEKTVYSYTKNIEVFERFTKQKGHDFQGIVEKWRIAKRLSVNEREDFLEAWSDIVRSFHTWTKKKYAPLSVKNLLATIKSYFGFWEIPIKVSLPRHACVIYHNKDLSKEEVRQVLSFASPRDRVMWLVMAESGMRAGATVNLKFWQIKEDFQAGRVPLNIQLPSSSLKDHVGDRWTFIGEDGCNALKEYLAQRLPLNDEEYVFNSEKPGKVRGQQFSVASLSVKFSRVVHKLGLTKTRGGKPKGIRMHGLRKFFRNNMKADSAYLKFWMGHSLGVDAHYISRNVEKHREEYAQGYRFLRVFEPSIESIADLTGQLRIRDQEIDVLKREVAVLQRDIQAIMKMEKMTEFARFEDGKLITHETDEGKQVLKEILENEMRKRKAQHDKEK